MPKQSDIPRNAISRALYLRDWTDSELAERAQISRSSLNVIKNARRMPTVGEALRIAAALGESLETLFDLDALRQGRRRD